MPVVGSSAIQRALAAEGVRPHLAGRRVVRRIYVPGKLVNLVTRFE